MAAKTLASRSWASGLGRAARAHTLPPAKGLLLSSPGPGTSDRAPPLSRLRALGLRTCKEPIMLL